MELEKRIILKIKKLAEGVVQSRKLKLMYLKDYVKKSKDIDWYYKTSPLRMETCDDEIENSLFIMRILASLLFDKDMNPISIKDIKKNKVIFKYYVSKPVGDGITKIVVKKKILKFE